jgi:CspA family cold shock protein
MENGKRYNGTVKFFDHDRGFGFIHCGGESKDFFLHISEVQRSGLTDDDLHIGTPVSFTLVAGNAKGSKCTELELI